MITVMETLFAVYLLGLCVLVVPATYRLYTIHNKFGLDRDIVTDYLTVLFAWPVVCLLAVIMRGMRGEP